MVNLNMLNSSVILTLQVVSLFLIQGKCVNRFIFLQLFKFFSKVRNIGCTDVITRGHFDIFNLIFIIKSFGICLSCSRIAVFDNKLECVCEGDYGQISTRLLIYIHVYIYHSRAPQGLLAQRQHRLRL